MDDHSEDDTWSIAKSLHIENLRVLRLEEYDLSDFSGKYKKAGQYHSIMEAKYDNILQTDADCEVPISWIKAMIQALDQSDMCTSSIQLKGPNTFLSKWQSFDSIGTMLLTHAGIESGLWYSANAANMAFKKELYLQYFADNEMSCHASGDDIFLINWTKQNDFDVKFVQSKDSLVATSVEPSLRDLFQQRLRWATKTNSYDSNGLKWLMGSLFLFHLAVVVSFVLFVLGVSDFKMICLLLLCAKWLGDTIVLLTASGHFNSTYNILLSPLYSIVHTIYVVMTGLAGLFLKNYHWKGRRVQ